MNGVGEGGHCGKDPSAVAGSLALRSSFRGDVSNVKTLTRHTKIHNRKKNNLSTDCMKDRPARRNPATLLKQFQPKSNQTVEERLEGLSLIATFGRIRATGLPIDAVGFIVAVNF